MVTREGSPPSSSAERRLNKLGIKLPPPPEPFGTYVEAVGTGNLLFLTGTLPTETATRNSLAAWAWNSMWKRDVRRPTSRRSMPTAFGIDRLH
jgi:hypothetical protein